MSKKVPVKSKRRLMIFGSLSVIMIGYFFVTLISYVINFTKLSLNEKQLKNDLIVLQEKGKNLKIEIQKLQDPDYVARYAKEKYLYSQNGEYIIKIDSKKEKTETNKKSFDKIYIFSGIALLFLLIIVFKKRKA